MYTPERYQTVIDSIEAVLSEYGEKYRSYHIADEESLWVEIVDEAADNLVDSIRTRDGDIIVFDYDSEIDTDDPEVQEAVETVDCTQAGDMLNAEFSAVLEKLTPKRRYREDDPKLGLKLKRWCRQAIVRNHERVEMGSYLKPYIKHRPNTN